MNSILDSIKTMLGISLDDSCFDPEICLFINAALSTLVQCGIGPAKGFVIDDRSSTWEEFLGDGVVDLETVKTYTYYHVRVSFDPPASSSVLEAFKELEKEALWRAQIQAEYDASDYATET